ncbi:putative membrane-bound O-acyltransferase [Ordospora pajunii]|uniref:putative membrane-bound O-acyltransferase n=1 Tax=Ordospora pajunii TaxID=3039483 RepID=UPI0029526291|nr:putative membrane-bound O-acyltransferase [Ordospora pajunii]KAH9411338.1 putative membrane-bound O-acyltransferase [Ordospora pajunii]
MEVLSKIDPLEKKMLISLLLTMLISYNMKNRSAIHSLVSSLIVLQIAFDYKHMLYLIASLSFNMILLKCSSMSRYSFTIINIAILYIYKTFGIHIEQRISGAFDISGILMLMTIKMSYLGKEYKKDRNTIRDALSYVLFIPGLLMGPVPTFESFMKNRYERPKKLFHGAFLKSILFLILFQTIRISIPKEYITQNLLPLPIRLMCLYLFTVGNRLKFYFVWHFSHGCFIFQNFPGLLNIDFLKVELATDVKELSNYWNIYAGVWLKDCFFDPIRGKSTFWASIATTTVAALWHGISPCYLIMFLSITTSNAIVKKNNAIVMKFCPSMFWILSRAQMFIITSYFTPSFFLLNLSELLNTWHGVYYIGHVFILLSLVLQMILKSIIHEELQKSKQTGKNKICN